MNQNENQNYLLRSKNITVAGGVMTIETNSVTFKERAIYILSIGTDFPINQGIEAVNLLIEGQLYPLIDVFGEIVEAGKMRPGKYDKCGNIETANYRLGYGANGMPSGVAHFAVFEGLCPLRYNGPTGAEVTTMTTAKTKD